MKLIIPGKPVAKKRPRFARIGKFVKTYSDQETEEGRFLFEVQKQLNGHKPIEGPVQVMLRFYLPRPKNHFGSGRNAYRLKPSAPPRHTKKPDIDNCIKFVLDCLNGVAWRDDSQIIKSIAVKEYGEPRTEIIIMGA